jgi:crotonobetainyl-CoA:carnitine CoA-transferase CaiB-like acyl-CoA transferase
MRLLQGVRVVEVGGFITGPLTAMILGEYGADVIKLERPDGGDPFRSHHGGGYSPAFQAHNRNKRSVAVDYAKPDGLKVLHALAKTADVFVNNNRPGVAERMGFGPAQLRAINPRLIYCAITGFGADGPYAERPAFDNVGQALSGWMSRHRRDDDPRVAGPAISDPATSYYAATAVLAALYERNRSGKGRLVEVNMLEATIALNLEPLAYYFDQGEPAGLFQRGGASQAYNLVCKDGRCIGVHMSSPDKFWQAFCRAIEREDWIGTYATRADRAKHYESIAFELRDIFAQRPRAEWIERLEREDVPFAPELGVQDLEHDPQVKHLGTIYELTHEKHGRVRAQHRPAKVDGSREIDFRPPPDLGEHTAEMLAELRRKGVL